MDGVSKQYHLPISWMLMALASVHATERNEENDKTMEQLRTDMEKKSIYLAMQIQPS